MARRRSNILILVFVLALIVVSGLIVANKETRLGLDLKGGTELVYQGTPTGKVEEVSGEDIERSIDIIRERVDELGVAEPEVSRLGTTEISVSLPDVTNAQRAIDQVGTTAQLYFYDWEPNLIGRSKVIGGVPGRQPPAKALEEANKEWEAAGRSPAKRENGQQIFSGAYPTAYAAVKLATEQKPEPDCTECSTNRPRYYLFSGDSAHELLAGPEFAKKDLFITATGEQRAGKECDEKTEQCPEVLVVPPGTVVVSELPSDESGSVIEGAKPGWYALRDRPALSGDDITDPKQEFNQFNQPNVTFEFTDEGREAFHRVTRQIAQRGQARAFGAVTTQQAEELSGRFAVVLDNEVKTRPSIDFKQYPDGIDGRTGAEIAGGFAGIQDAQDLATFLQIGALPINLKLISQTQVSATLGEQALDQGLKAGLIGLALVILFLLLYYRLLGVVATLGLAVYAVVFFALIKLIPVTMTLPGIAGLILTIGVAADSNIVIFERIKEEVRAGRSLTSAIAVGYRRGIATIIDANVITLLTAFILFVLATAGVKGFAFTLGVGTIVSLFTAVVFTQALFGIFGRGLLNLSPRLLGASEDSRARWRFNFIGASRWFFSASGVILVVGALALAGNQLNFGIDFESGTRLNFAPQEQNVTVEDVRAVLEEEGLGEAEIQETENDRFGTGFQVQTGELQPGGVSEVRGALTAELGTQPGSFENTSVGPTFGEQIARSAMFAIIFSLLLISAYVAFRFEAKYAVPVLIAVAHDILITAGVYSLVDKEVSSGTVAAFLTILGYSLYDCVIVFDRIRENVPRMPRAAFSQIVNRSMSEVLTRSLITGLSAVFLVAMLLVFGGATLQDFAFAMMVGIFSGTYSSIFIASPVLTAWKEREPGFVRRRERIASSEGKVPAFVDDTELARLDGEEAAQEAEIVPEEEEEVALVGAEPDGAKDGDDPAAAERRERNRRRRERRQQRRKHGRNR
ncbi:MAG TPA: protein translocase subunit SecD [Solirubrobacterales bacterium]|nr:protein translocase subunit SecD [Solirubrobacterales bacterium]